MISGIVLAAGASSRMGQAKAALPVNDTGETVVARVVRTVIAGGVPEVVVVAGAHIDAVRVAMPAFETRARMIEHPGWERGQLSSLLAGLDAVDELLLEAVIVTPVDVPMIAASTVAAVIAAWRTTRAPIVRPVSGLRHGHPVIFDRAVFGDLRAADVSLGAKAVFALHRERVLNVEVEDRGAFDDIDTPEDYQRVVRQEWSRT
ncbi:MAG TPA: nucleotidyltransferase family protein [Vicinamibacterales bacterium]|nr:nucleotidyltransferase family protein [Vicinamibacterales bacterium]